MAMVDAMQTDNIEVVHEWLDHLHDALQFAQQVKAKRWKQLQMTKEQAEAVLEDYGLAGGNEKKQGQLFHLLGELLGLFASAGIAKADAPHFASVWDLMNTVGDDIEKIIKSKGGMKQILDDKRTKLYKLSPRRFFKNTLEGEDK